MEHALFTVPACGRQASARSVGRAIADAVDGEAMEQVDKPAAPASSAPARRRIRRYTRPVALSDVVRAAKPGQGLA